jgi:hypothetical protein
MFPVETLVEGAVEGFHIDSRNRRKNFVSEEYNTVRGTFDSLKPS